MQRPIVRIIEEVDFFTRHVDKESCLNQKSGIYAVHKNRLYVSLSNNSSNPHSHVEFPGEAWTKQELPAAKPNNFTMRSWAEGQWNHNQL